MLHLGLSLVTFRVDQIVEFRVKKLLHLGWWVLLHLALIFVTFRVVVTFSVDFCYILALLLHLAVIQTTFNTIFLFFSSLKLEWRKLALVKVAFWRWCEVTRNGSQSQSQFFLWAGILAPELIKNSVETVVKLTSLSRTSLMKALSKLSPIFKDHGATLKVGGGGGAD